MFRATRVVNVSKGLYLEEARLDANHQSKNTTYYNYLRPEKNNLFLKQDEEIENSNPKIKKL